MRVSGCRAAGRRARGRDTRTRQGTGRHRFAGRSGRIATGRSIGRAPTPASAGAIDDRSRRERNLAAERTSPGRRDRVFPRACRARLGRAARTDGTWGWPASPWLLAVCGGVVAAARRFSPQGAAGAIQVVSRVSLSPKHTVYLLRVGRRVLLVGAGPQGAPSLISELDDLAEIEPDPRQGEEA